MPDTRPNVILIMTDQHRGDCLGIEDHPALLTPNIDALAGGGSHFRRAYSTCPSCIPARRTLLSGQHPATNGMVGFNSIPQWNPKHTLPGELSKAGYQTYFVGRTMHQEPVRKRFGYDHMVLGSSHLVDDDYDRDCKHKTDHVDGFFSHGIDFNGPTARSFHMDESLHPTNWVINESMRFLETRDPSCPFFLTVSFYAPHPPFVPPAFYMDRYLRMDLPAPAIGDWAVAPPNRGKGLSVSSTKVDLQGEYLRSCLAGYYGLINHIDDQIHRILHPRSGGYDMGNTVVIFTSDHGEMLGDHHYFRKCEPYEGSARIPFVIGGGAKLGFKRGQTFTNPVCLEDIMPTVLDVAGCAIPDGLNGRSLVPMLRGEAYDWRPWLHGEHAPCYSQEQANHYLTDGKVKYIWRPVKGTEEFFDLEADPKELRNLAASEKPDPRVAHWRQTLVEHLTSRPEGFVADGKLVAGRPYDGLLAHAAGETT